MLGFWVTCGVTMMSLCQGWGRQPLQTASLIHTTHIQSVWAYWYAIHQHTTSALHSFTHPNWLRCWGSGSLVESKWCHYVKVETDSHFKLLSPSILHIYEVFEHIDMLSISIKHKPYTVLLTLFGSDIGVLGHLWSQNDVIMSRLRLTATSNCFPHPYKTYTKCLSTFICCPSAYNSSLIQISTLLCWFWGLGVTCVVKMMSLRQGWGWQPLQTASHIQLDIYKVFEHTDMLSISIQQQPCTVLLFYLAQMLGFWVTCGFKMMSLCQGWGWQPLQNASLIRIRHIRRKSLSTLIFVMLPLPSLHWYLCSCCAAVFTVVELAPCHCAVTFIKMALFPSLNLNWRDGPPLLHALGRWPLPLPSYLCNWSLNGREGPSSNGTSIDSNKHTNKFLEAV